MERTSRCYMVRYKSEVIACFRTIASERISRPGPGAVSSVYVRMRARTGDFWKKNGIWQLLLRNAFLTRYFSYGIRTGFEYLDDFVKTRDFQDFF